MRVERQQLVLKNRVYRIEAARFRVQPRINVLRLDWNRAAVVPGLGNLRRRIVGDDGERQQILFVGLGRAPVLSHAVDEQRLRRARAEFERDVLPSRWVTVS